jgi:hypothetical protein
MAWKFVPREHTPLRAAALSRQVIFPLFPDPTSDKVLCMELADIVRLILVAIFIALLFQGSVLESLLEAINNFRGGPPTPRHPLPADDGAILRRRPSRRSSRFYHF